MSSIIKSSQIRIVDTPIINNNEQKKREVDLSTKIEESKAMANKIIENAKMEAQSIILNARQNAEKVLEDTHSHVKNIVDDAREEGYKKGFEEGYTKGKKTSDALIEEANNIKKGYLREREIIFSSIEKDIIHMVMSLCEKIVNQKLDNDKEAIIPIILKGINSLNTKENLMIKVSAEDYDIVEMSKQRILATANLVEDIQVRVDSTLSKGGCIIEGSKGNVDASIDLQIKEMKKLLNTLLNGE